MVKRRKSAALESADDAKAPSSSKTKQDVSIDERAQRIVVAIGQSINSSLGHVDQDAFVAAVKASVDVLKSKKLKFHLQQHAEEYATSLWERLNSESSKSHGDEQVASHHRLLSWSDRLSQLEEKSASPKDARHALEEVYSAADTEVQLRLLQLAHPKDAFALTLCRFHTCLVASSTRMTAQQAVSCLEGVVARAGASQLDSAVAQPLAGILAVCSESWTYESSQHPSLSRRFASAMASVLSLQILSSCVADKEPEPSFIVASAHLSAWNMKSSCPVLLEEATSRFLRGVCARQGVLSSKRCKKTVKRVTTQLLTQFDLSRVGMSRLEQQTREDSCVFLAAILGRCSVLDSVLSDLASVERAQLLAQLHSHVISPDVRNSLPSMLQEALGSERTYGALAALVRAQESDLKDLERQLPVILQRNDSVGQKNADDVESSGSESSEDEDVDDDDDMKEDSSAAGGDDLGGGALFFMDTQGTMADQANDSADQRGGDDVEDSDSDAEEAVVAAVGSKRPRGKTETVGDTARRSSRTPKKVKPFDPSAEMGGVSDSDDGDTKRDRKARKERTGVMALIEEEAEVSEDSGSDDSDEAQDDGDDMDGFIVPDDEVEASEYSDDDGDHDANDEDDHDEPKDNADADAAADSDAESATKPKAPRRRLKQRKQVEEEESVTSSVRRSSRLRKKRT